MKIKTFFNKKCIKFFSITTPSILTGCSYLYTPNTLNKKSAAERAERYKEHFTYRIDDHRYMTIKGTDSCVGRIYYYDTKLGIRISVATTGLTLGNGVFNGYYAADSDHVVVPAIEFSDMNGPLLYIYYSIDKGRTFKYFLSSGYGDKNQTIILKENNLFIGDRDSDNQKIFTWVYRYDLNSGLRIDDSQQIPPEQEQRVSSGTVPLETTSPSKSTRWVCGDPF